MISDFLYLINSLIPNVIVQDSIRFDSTLKPEITISTTQSFSYAASFELSKY